MVSLLTRAAVVSGMALVFLCHAQSQPTQSFDAAAIRLNTSGGAGSRFNVPDATRLRVVNATLLSLIGRAFHMQRDQIAGGPAWLDSDRYDIDAAAAEDGIRNHLETLLQNLLADRFQLRYHRETREKTIYALVVGKNGPKLKDHVGGIDSTLNTHTGSGKITLTGSNASMGQLADYLGNKLGRVVLDKTGLGGSYDFTFDWDPEQATDSASPTMFTGLREQLGLRLESQKGPVEMLVIDKAEQPSGN